MSYEIALVIGVVGMSFGMGFLSSIIDEKHYAVKLLLILSSLYVYLGLASLLPNIIDANESTIGVTIAGQLNNITSGLYTGFLWVTLLITAYFLVYFLYEGLSSVKMRRRDGEEEE